MLADLKSDPGPLGLDTLMAETGKLSIVRALGLDESVFAGTSDRIIAAWRARAARMYPSDFEECGEPVRYTVVNATLEAREPQWWGEATSTASDSKRFASWDSNLMTEFHAR